MIDEALNNKIHELARERFEANPEKCSQKHCYEVWDEHDKKPRLESLDGTFVERISYEEADDFIRKYEHLSSMPTFLKACYGLKLNGELVGASCFEIVGGPARNICGAEYASKTVCLARGASLPNGSENLPSFQTRAVSKQAFIDFGWQIFFAYSDFDAGEVGTIYEAIGAEYLGAGRGRPEGSFHVDFKSSDGIQTITSNALNHDKDKKIFRDLGWNEAKGDPRQYLLHLGWKQINKPGKGTWLWIEGTPSEKEYLKSLCRYPFLEKPKRRTAVPIIVAAADLGISKREAKRRAWKAEHPEDMGKSNQEINSKIHRAYRMKRLEETNAKAAVIRKEHIDVIPSTSDKSANTSGRKSKLTPERQADLIRDSASGDYAKKHLAIKYKVSYSYVCLLLRSRRVKR